MLFAEVWMMLPVSVSVLIGWSSKCSRQRKVMLDDSNPQASSGENSVTPASEHTSA